MKVLKFIGLVVLVLWMAFITLEIEHTKNLAAEACAFAVSATAHPPPETMSLPLGCPDVPVRTSPQKSN